MSWAPEDAAARVHGTAGFDLDDTFPAEDPRSRREAEDPRLFALGHWPKRVFSATADQFLAFLAYGDGPVCLLPLLADSVVVIDEVHGFDRAMPAAVRGFVDQFDVPVLCTTATLPEGRKEQLAAGRQKRPTNPVPADLKVIADAPATGSSGRPKRTPRRGSGRPVGLFRVPPEQLVWNRARSRWRHASHRPRPPTRPDPGSASGTTGPRASGPGTPCRPSPRPTKG